MDGRHREWMLRVIVMNSQFHNNLLSSSTVSECLSQQCSSWWQWQSEIHQIPLRQYVFSTLLAGHIKGTLVLDSSNMMYTVQQGCRSSLKFLNQNWLVNFTQQLGVRLVLICLPYLQGSRKSICLDQTLCYWQRFGYMRLRGHRVMCNQRVKGQMKRMCVPPAFRSQVDELSDALLCNADYVSVTEKQIYDRPAGRANSLFDN